MIAQLIGLTAKASTHTRLQLRRFLAFLDGASGLQVHDWWDMGYVDANSPCYSKGCMLCAQMTQMATLRPRYAPKRLLNDSVTDFYVVN